MPPRSAAQSTHPVSTGHGPGPGRPFRGRGGSAAGRRPRLLDPGPRHRDRPPDVPRPPRRDLLRELTGAEAATIANNNAAATVLILNTLAQGKEVIVSRGQLVEIGGSFRMPDVMKTSGAILREVGTTNKTHLRDYEEAIGETTGAILRVHHSNYRIVGFAEEPGIDELVGLGRSKGVPVVDDLGSGALVDLREFGLATEPLVQASIRAGADVVCFSAATSSSAAPSRGSSSARPNGSRRSRRTRWPARSAAASSVSLPSKPLSSFSSCPRT